MQNRISHLTASKHIEPKETDVAFASINTTGAPGELNGYVLSNIGYDINDLPNKKALSKGFSILTDENKKSVIFIVTIGYRSTAESLRMNLSNALWELQLTGLFIKKNIWIPLMGTGAGKLSLQESFDITFKAIDSLKNLVEQPKSIVIALPPEIDPKTEKYINNKIENWNKNEFEIKFNPILKQITEKKLKDKIQQALTNGKNFWWYDSKDNNNIQWNRQKDRQQRRFYNQGADIAKVLNNLEAEDLILTLSNGHAIGILEVENSFRPLYRELNGLFQFPKPIAISLLLSAVDLTEEFMEPATLVDKLYPIKGSEVQAIDIQALIQLADIGQEEGEQPSIVGNRLKSPSYDSDSAYATEDLLDIENDVQSFALLLASKNILPPIAVALFGSWGSGKSFFMEHLSRQVGELSIYQRFLEPNEDLPEDIQPQSPEGDFCPGIAQIKFNAWSYLDANLWAGLTHSLFEKLNEYITTNTKGKLERLKVQIKITERLNILNTDLENYKEKKTRFLHLKQELEKEKENKILRYFTPKYDKIITPFLKSNGFDEEEINLLTPSKLRNRVDRTLSFFSYLKSKSYDIFSKVFLWSMILLMIVMISQNHIGDLYENVSSFYSKFIAVVMPVFVAAGHFFLKRWKFLASLSKLIEEYESISTDEELKGEIKELKHEIDKIDPLIDEIESKIEYEKSKKTEITQVAIANFISSKPEQKEYKSRLGIVSIIRKDFETLSELFYDNFEEDASTNLSIELNKDRKEIANQFEKGKKLNRIILYIDDLDRCSDEKVLEVIQAVHLLMAFPLFNVVVGVDKRCVHNALTYKNLLQYSQFASLDDVRNEGISEISPDEYLEKIFQIPFQLREASNSQIKNIIDHLLANQIDKEDKASIPRGSDETKTLEERKVSKLKERKVNDDPSDNTTSPSKDPDSKIEDNEDQALEEDNPPEPTKKDLLSTEDLSFSQEEFNYLKEIMWLVGNSPRTVKRFINIYRIIRAHERPDINEEIKHSDYLAIMFILAIGIGQYKGEAEDLFSILEDHPLYDLATVLSKSKNLKLLFEQINDHEAIRFILDEKAGLFNKHLSFVRRFSFG